jgi:hypothetical protein
VWRLATPVLLGAAIALAGTCAEEGPEGWRPSPREGGPRIVVTRDDGSLPRGCGLREVARRVAEFEHAVSAGNAPAAAALLAAEPQFQWYWSTLLARSATLRNDSFERPRGLSSYLSRRAEQRERLRPLVIQVVRIPPRTWFPRLADTVAGFNHHLERRAGDIHPSRPVRNHVAFAKGALNCRTGKLVAWGMGLDIATRPPDLGRMCPAPPRRSGRATVIACTE